MKNEYDEEVEMFFPGQFEYEELEEASPAVPTRTTEEQEADEAEWRAIELREITCLLENEGYIEATAPHDLTISPWLVRGGAPRSELLFFAKNGLEDETMAEAVKKVADVLTRALPEGEAWTIGLDVFSDEIGRIRVEGRGAERTLEFLMTTMAAYFRGAAA